MSKECNVDECLPLGYNFSLLTKNFYGVFHKYMEKYDLERYFSVLLIIAGSDKKWTQQCLCDRLLIDKVSMVKVLDHLFEKGYVTRVVNPADRRQRWIQLTSKAKKEIPMIRNSVKEMNDKTLAGFSKKEKTTFLTMMQQVNRNLNSLPANVVIVRLNQKIKKIKK
jgi:DNA-binding MarR family transcriptional regulator